MTTLALNPNNGAPGGPAPGASVPAPAAPESTAATPPAAGGAPSAEVALVADVLKGAAPVAGAVSPKAATDDDDVLSGDETTISGQFSEFDENFESEVGEKPQVTPEVAPAPVATPAKVPAPAAPVAAPEVPAPPVGEVKPSIPDQPVVEIPPSFDLFAPVEQPAAPPATKAGETAEQPAPPSGETGEQRMTRLRADYVAKLEKAYALSEEDARAVMLEPETVLPKMLAKVHTEVIEAATTGILQQLPTLIQQVVMVNRAQQELNKSFFTTWPQLTKAEYANTVRGILHAYRQNNPNAPWDQTVREAGAMAMIALKLPLPQSMVGVQTPAPAPAMAPVVPASPGSGTPVARATETNPFARLDEEWDHEETLNE